MSENAARSAPDRDAVVAALQAFFAGTNEDLVAAAYLFGSVARGEARASSDVDVAVLYAKDPPRTLEALPTALQMALSRLLQAPVEVVVLNKAPVDLVKRVLRDGILVLDRDRSRRIAFEVDARNRYWDIEPLLRRYRAPVRAR
jgi:predicted nucleotidyltransferase